MLDPLFVSPLDCTPFRFAMRWIWIFFECIFRSVFQRKCTPNRQLCTPNSPHNKCCRNPFLLPQNTRSICILLLRTVAFRYGPPALVGIVSEIWPMSHRCNLSERILSCKWAAVLECLIVSLWLNAFRFYNVKTNEHEMLGSFDLLFRHQIINCCIESISPR